MMSRSIILQNYPKSFPTHSNVKLVNRHVELESKNRILIRSLYLSVDPYMRNRLRSSGTKYIDALQIGEPIVSMGIGEVLDSQAAHFKPGDKIIGMIPWQEFSTIDASTVKPIRSCNLPLTAQLSILGYPGLTAYVGIHHIAKPQPGQTIFISSAAGAVGSIAGQLAKLNGCYVVGCASSDEKIKYLIDDLKYDAAFNYLEHQDDYVSAIKKFCPHGIDINFENVGGAILEAAIDCLNPRGIIVLCGAISQYNSLNPRQGPKNFNLLISKRAKLEGFIVTNYDYLFDEFQNYMIQLCEERKITYRETVVKGLENSWKAFISLFEGKNIGKMIVSIERPVC